MSAPTASPANRLEQALGITDRHGVSLTTIRDTVYFGGHDLWRGVGVLVLWATVPLAVAAVAGRDYRAATPAPDTAPAR